MKITTPFRFLRLALVATSALSLDAQGSSQTPRSPLSFAQYWHSLKGTREADPTGQRQIKRRIFAISALGSVPGRQTNHDGAETILAKYGLQSALPNKFHPKATLPGSVRDKRNRLCKSTIAKICQLSLIAAASKVSNNRIRQGVNIIRWSIATAFLAIIRWYGRLVASSPSELFRRIGYDLVDERGFVKSKFPIVDGDGSGAMGMSNGESLAVVRQMPGDGSCLFYALAAGLLQSDADKHSADSPSTLVSWASIREKADELRQMAVDTLECGSDRNLLSISDGDKVRSSILLQSAAASFGMSAKEYCKSMRRPSCWGGGVELVALSNALKGQICMYEPLLLDDGRLALRKIICFGPSPKSAEQPLHVLIANDDFPAKYHQQGQLGAPPNHFLAVFLVD